MIWNSIDYRIYTIRVNPKEKLKIRGNICYKCKFILGEYDYNLFLEYLNEEQWKIEKRTDHLINTIRLTTPLISYVLPDSNSSLWREHYNFIDFKSRMKYFLKLHELYGLSTQKLYQKLFGE